MIDKITIENASEERIRQVVENSISKVGWVVDEIDLSEAYGDDMVIIYIGSMNASGSFTVSEMQSILGTLKQFDGTTFEHISLQNFIDGHWETIARLWEETSAQT